MKHRSVAAGDALDHDRPIDGLHDRQIREGLQENLKTTPEDLNRRGIYDSGISLDVESKLRKSSASDEAMLLASRLSKLQDQLSQGLASIRSQKYNTAQSFGREAAQAQFTAGENAKRNAYDREQAALQGMANLRGQLSGKQNAAANRSFQGQESQLDRQFRAQQAEVDRQYGDAQSRAKTAAEFEQNRRAYERESALIAQRAGAGACGGGGTSRSTASASPAQGTGDVTQDAIAALQSVFTNATDANNAIKEQMAELAAAGVDIAALFDAAQGLGSRRAGTSDY